MKSIISSNAVRLLVILFIVGCSSSCKKLIEIPANPSNEIPSSLVFADSATVMTAIAGVYNNFGAASGSKNFLSGTVTLFAGLSSDEIAVGQADDLSLLQFSNNALQSNNSELSDLWDKPYAGLYQVNACLEGVNLSTGLSATLKKQLTAELKVVRALYYFNMVNLFGPVPLITSTDYNSTSKQPRTAVDEVYKLIIADLTEAHNDLGTSYPSALRARPNVYTAAALLAKVYLYRGDWQKAEDMTTEVISSGAFGLEEDLNNVFLSGSNEAIWQIPANGQYSQTPEAGEFIPYYPGMVPIYPLTTFLQQSFETGDQRFQNWIGLSEVDENSDGSVITPYYYPAKYKNRDAASATTESYMILRFAEQYLIRAEARARLGSARDAIADVDMIRLRAGLKRSTAVSQTDVIAAVMHERQTELFCEWGNRWFDLKRTGTADAVLGAEKTGWQATDALYPIPFQQRQSNPALTQNPGYN